MDPLMSPFSMGTTTPLHHPDEDLTNFNHNNQTNQVYHSMMNPPKQMAQHTNYPSLMMPQPPTPVSYFAAHDSPTNFTSHFQLPAKSFRSHGASISFDYS
jgi:hypothetical protein